ncbi:glycoside hydrolase family 28 protein [Fulvivirga sp. M361]|nr:glycoside hydrolase family 28 protein [Fulvivirga sp. M361]
MKYTLVLCYLLVSVNLLSKDINILTFGAKPDGETLNTSFIQKAIDKVSNAGGGKVIIPAGTFLSGSIILKSGVHLYLEENAILLGTTDIYQYTKLNSWKALVLADQVNNIKITGKGIIDGQGRKLALNVDSLFHIGEINIGYNFRRMRPNEDGRPQLINFKNCKNIEVSGIELRNASNWVQTYDQCHNLEIDNISVNSTVYWNNDGIDISDCKNVRITNSFINSADDGICLKSHSAEHSNDSIYIANCTVRSSASAIKFGTASDGGFKNVKIHDITVYDTFRSAIALESVDGGVLENIDISDIVATNTGNGIFIRLGHRNTQGQVGVLKNISIRNVRVEIPFEQPDLYYDCRGPRLPFFHNPFPNSITGIEGHYVENVHLENITITHPGRASSGYAQVPLYRLAGVPENASDYPEFHMFGELPAWGFYVRHVKGLTFKNVQLKLKEDDFRPALVFDDVHDLELDGLKVYPRTTHDQLIFWNVEDYNIAHSTVDDKKLDSPVILENVITGKNKE